MSAAAPHPRSDGRTLLESTYRGTVGETDLALADPADHIVDLAEQRGADLIIVGTHEPAFLDRHTSTTFPSPTANDPSAWSGCGTLCERSPNRWSSGWDSEIRAYVIHPHYTRPWWR